MTTLATTDAGQLASGSPGVPPHTQTDTGVRTAVWRADRVGVPGRGQLGLDPAGPIGDPPELAPGGRGGRVGPVRDRGPVPRW
ncbi:MAG: hypothetical protein ACJ72I_25155 [Pseudonocardiaceae bacterium]